MGVSELKYELLRAVMGRMERQGQGDMQAGEGAMESMRAQRLLEEELQKTDESGAPVGSERNIRFMRKHKALIDRWAEKLTTQLSEAAGQQLVMVLRLLSCTLEQCSSRILMERANEWLEALLLIVKPPKKRREDMTGKASDERGERKSGGKKRKRTEGMKGEQLTSECDSDSDLFFSLRKGRAFDCFRVIISRLSLPGASGALKSTILQHKSLSALPSVLARTLIASRAVKSSEEEAITDPVPSLMCMRSALALIRQLHFAAPNLMKNHSQNIENAISPCLFHPESDVRDLSIAALASLPAASRASDTSMANARCKWTNVAIRVCRLQNDALDAILGGVEPKSAQLDEVLAEKAATMGEKTSPYHGSNKVELSDVTLHGNEEGGAWHRLDKLRHFDIVREELCHLVISSYRVLEEMIANAFTSVIDIPAEVLLLCAQRALALDRGLLLASLRSKAVVDTTAISVLLSYLPTIHCTVQEMLQSLLERLRGDLIPLSQTLSDVISVSFSSSFGSEGTAMDVQRSAAFQTAAMALQYLGPSLLDSVAVPSLSHAISELKAMGEAYSKFELVPLYADQSSAAGKGGSKRARRKRALQQAMSGADESNGTPQAPRYAALVSALSLVESVIRNVGTLLDSELRQSVDGLLASALLPCLCVGTIQTSSLLRVPEVRCSLYKALKACLLSVHDSSASVLSFAAPLFAAGARDPASEVSVCCREALAVVNALLHPVRPIAGEQVFLEESLESVSDFIQVNTTSSGSGGRSSHSTQSTVTLSNSSSALVDGGVTSKDTSLSLAVSASGDEETDVLMEESHSFAEQESSPGSLPADETPKKVSAFTALAGTMTTTVSKTETEAMTETKSELVIARETVARVSDTEASAAVDRDLQAEALLVAAEQDQEMGEVPDIVEELPESDLSDLSSGEDY